MADETALVRDLGFLEGPLWCGDRLLVVSVSRGLVYQIDPETGDAGIVGETGGNPTGLASDHEGRVWVAQGGGHSRTRSSRPVRPGIQCLTEGSLVDVVTEGVNAPNDCMVGPDGRIWFTDPVGSPFGTDGPGGRVMAFDPGTGSLETVTTGLRYPNGIALDNEGRVLVAETGKSRVRQFESDGRTETGLVFELPAGHPDGLAVDVEGFVYVATVTSGSITVFAADGVVAEILDIEPECVPTNLCFGGADHRTLFVTLGRGGRVIALERRMGGLLRGTCRGASQLSPPLI